VTDLAGNMSTALTDSNVATNDTIAPALSVANLNYMDNSGSSSDQISGSAGAAEAGATITAVTTDTTTPVYGNVTKKVG
jgi:hypothetical protein